MEWVKTEDETDVLLSDLCHGPGWWIDMEDEINLGQALLSGITWPASRMPAHESVGSGANTGRGSERRSDYERDGSQFPPGQDSRKDHSLFSGNGRVIALNAHSQDSESW